LTEDPEPPAAAPPGLVSAHTGQPAPHLDPSYTRAASICPGLNPAVLAAIHIVETRQGKDDHESIAGAIGPMQFLPGTWARYGIDGNGDGRADIHNFSDALFSAAHYLCANGGNVASKLPSAVWHYNHSQNYTAQVLALAQRL
jgi:membrane-bound lytic murein transglycosylase B